MSQSREERAPVAFSIRPTTYPRDVQRVVTIANTERPDPTTVEAVIAHEAVVAVGTIGIRLVAETADGAVAGYVEAVHSPWDEEGAFELELVVDPTWRGRGAGSALWDAARDSLAAAHATRIEAQIRDTDATAERFAQARAFLLERRRFESTLDLASFEWSRFAGVIERLEACGARFLSLADAGDTEDARRTAYEINRRAALDIPGRAQTFAPFEEWRRFVCGATWYRPEGQILVALGQTWVGLSAVGYYAASNSMYNMITGVDRAYRGRGLALGLKLRTIQLAQRLGADYIRTHNDSENAPMLAINHRLGYQPEPGLLMYTWKA